MKNKVLSSLYKLVLLLALIVLAVYMSRFISESSVLVSFIGKYGYIAVFVAGLIGGLNFVIPVPAITFMPFFLAGGLNPVIVVVVIALAATLADTLSYLFGSAGRDFVLEENSKLMSYLDRKKDSNMPWLYFLLFLFASFAPLPNEILVVGYAFIGVSYKKILPIVFIGNLVFNSLGALGFSYFI